MAKVLESFDFESSKGGAKKKYPWDQWLNGQIWELHQGSDFTIKLETFRISVQKTSSMRGLRTRSSINTARGTITIQTIGKKDAK